jgi:hypothetical protein
MTKVNPIQPLEFCNMYHETESQHKSLTWKNNNIKFITNQNI